MVRRHRFRNVQDSVTNIQSPVEEIFQNIAFGFWSFRILFIGIRVRSTSKKLGHQIVFFVQMFGEFHGIQDGLQFVERC